MKRISPVMVVLLLCVCCPLLLAQPLHALSDTQSLDNQSGSTSNPSIPQANTAGRKSSKPHAKTQSTTPNAAQPQTQEPPLKTSETVVIVGSAEPVTQGESTRAVVVRDAQPHRLSFDTQEDYLRTDTSVDIQQRGGGGTQSDISVRGASFEQTLVLVNGLRVNDAQTAHFNLDVPVPLGAIDKVEILHGTGSTLYGSDAIGGVVDMRTLAPTDTWLRLRAGGGSFGGNQESFTGAWARSRWSHVLAGWRDSSDGFKADRDYRSEDGSYEGRVLTRLGQSDVLLAGSDRAFGADQFYGDYPSWERTKGWFASLNQQLGQNTSAALGYRRHSDIYVLIRSSPATYKNQHIDESWQGVLRRSQRFHSGELFYGLEENTDQIRSNALGNHGRNRGAGYASLELHTDKRWSLQAGAREEVFSGGRSVFSPSLGGSFWLNNRLKSRLSVGRGFRLPNYTDLYYNDPTTASNPALKPESAWNFDGGLDFFAGHAVASLTVFYSRQQNAIDYVRATDTDKWQASNLAGLRFTGIESSLIVELPHHHQLRTGWTWINGAQQALHGLESQYVFNYPVNHGSVEWMKTWGGQIFMRNRVAVVQRYNSTPYSVWDLSFSREAGRIHPYVRMTNLANTGYVEVQNVTMPGRALTAGAELVLGRAHGAKSW